MSLRSNELHLYDKKKTKRINVSMVSSWHLVFIQAVTYTAGQSKISDLRAEVRNTGNDLRRSY
jgi:hypothetical protein